MNSRWPISSRGIRVLMLFVVAVLFGTAACGSGNEPPPPPEATHPDGDVLSTSVSQGAPYGVAVSRLGVTYAALIGTNTLVRGTLSPP